MRRRFPVSVSVSVCLAVLAVCCRGDSRPPSPRPSLSPARSGNGLSVLLITIDTLRADHLGLYGYHRQTSPHLDAYAAQWREDGDLKVAISRLKLKFLSSAEAMLHGDLHTGSVMLTEDDTRIIDPEFAFMGPMGFDTGAVIANFLLSYFSQDGHEERAGARDAYRAWILATTETIWTSFHDKFLDHWARNATGDAFPADLFQDRLGEARLAGERKAYMQRLWRDTLGFAAAKMIRRILGLAHNIDLELIKDPTMRARCEARALLLARDMMVNPENYPSPADLTGAARNMREIEPALKS